jgi:hypothetical protein
MTLSLSFAARFGTPTDNKGLTLTHPFSLWADCQTQVFHI